MKTLTKIALLLGLLVAPFCLTAAPFHTKTVEGATSALMASDGAAADASRITSKKYLFIYFSAHWCPPCRKFTPHLVEFYNANKQKGDFEILFVSSDKDQSAMNEYMKSTSMPWVGMKLGQAKAKELKTKYGVKGIPCLVLLDENETVLASSYEGDKYVGPAVALEKYLSMK